MATTILPFPLPSSQPTRRAVLGGLVTGTAAAAVGVTPTLGAGARSAAGEVDPHPAWLARIIECKRLQNTPDLLTDAQAGELIFDVQIKLEDLLYETPARTLAGVRAQIAACVMATEELTFGKHERGCLQVALATLDQLMREAGHA